MRKYADNVRVKIDSASKRADNASKRPAAARKNAEDVRQLADNRSDIPNIADVNTDLLSYSIDTLGVVVRVISYHADSPSAFANILRDYGLNAREPTHNTTQNIDDQSCNCSNTSDTK